MCSILSPLPLSLYFLLIYPSLLLFFFFFFNDTATTEIYTLSLHDALPIWPDARRRRHALGARVQLPLRGPGGANHPAGLARERDAPLGGDRRGPVAPRRDRAATRGGGGRHRARGAGLPRETRVGRRDRARAR